jgi:hypothetical protein
MSHPTALGEAEHICTIVSKKALSSNGIRISSCVCMNWNRLDVPLVAFSAVVCASVILDKVALPASNMSKNDQVFEQSPHPKLDLVCIILSCATPFCSVAYVIPRAKSS